MIPTNPLRFTATILLALLASACTGSTASPAAPDASNSSGAGSSPDPCAPENLPGSVQILNEYMRQFDNQVSLAASIARAESGLVIPPMQQLRSSVQDQAVGTCLDELKRLQLQYMDMTLEVLQPSQGPTPDAATVTAGMLEAHQFRDQYAAELARLLDEIGTSQP